MTDAHSFLGSTDINALDALYQRYKADPHSVDISWQRFFEGFDFRKSDFPVLDDSSSDAPGHDLHREFKVINLINGYRSRGHLFTKTNPVRERRKYSPTLALENFGLSESDLQSVFQAGNEVGLGPATLKEIVDHLEECYCSSTGVEFAYIREPKRAAWLRERIEAKSKPSFSNEEKKQIFEIVSKATLFEQYIQKRFVGQKRFSVEGCESVIPALDFIVKKGADLGVQEFVIGMAHRGRLNVLTNILGKPQQDVFTEFEGLEYEGETSFDGDVKYHLGYSRKVKLGDKDVHLTLCPNPSHLEAVNPVVEGLTRAKIDSYLKSENKIVPILIHGDAAIAAQGIVYEVIQMELLDGYRTGGTIHLVTNNQVGFTTNYLDARSSTYCTDVGKTTLSPVFHVNADDVEAVVRVTQLALEYRMTFNMDVFIDLLGYRKYGHNEGDEPKFTQPTLYKLIAAHPSLREIYTEKLIGEQVIDEIFADKTKREFEALLDVQYEESRTRSRNYVKHFLEQTWSKYRKAEDNDFDQSPETGFDKKKLLALGKKVSTLPEDKKFFSKTSRVFKDRLAMLESDKLDWGMVETLAYASLLEEGHPVRVSGQDVERGTFSHRHAVVKTDEDNEEDIVLLNSLSDKQAKFTIYNSLLSEYGVLGFEYGYAFGVPNGLTIWEAQFGDFNNGAQIIIDQFISAAEDKWRTMNGLVMLLPHGYEGQGSEHSSARLERFLQLCGENNMVICNATTPANFYHMLRRQVKWSFRKPLVVFTPKKLLRYPKAISSVNDLASGRFQEIIDDVNVKKKEVDTVVLCSGKVYYELLEAREKNGVENIAFVRLEQLYPLPDKQLRSLLATYNSKSKLIWVQEEPENMGAWSYIMRVMRDLNLDVIALPASASPATGSPKIHEQRMNDMIGKVMHRAKIKA